MTWAWLAYGMIYHQAVSSLSLSPGRGGTRSAGSVLNRFDVLPSSDPLSSNCRVQSLPLLFILTVYESSGLLEFFTGLIVQVDLSLIHI